MIKPAITPVLGIFIVIRKGAAKSRDIINLPCLPINYKNSFKGEFRLTPLC